MVLKHFVAHLCLIILYMLIVYTIQSQGKVTEYVVHHRESKDPRADGFWTQKTTWQWRWVNYWQPKAIYVPIWKRVWTPTIHNEYVPLPNTPTDWKMQQADADT